MFPWTSSSTSWPPSSTSPPTAPTWPPTSHPTTIPTRPPFVVYNITVPYYTSSTPSRISSRSVTLFNDPIILANCAIRINRSSFRTSIRLTFFMAYYNLDADYHQLVIATNFLVPCKLTSRGTTSTSYLPTDTFGDSL